MRAYQYMGIFAAREVLRSGTRSQVFTTEARPASLEPHTCRVTVEVEGRPWREGDPRGEAVADSRPDSWVLATGRAQVVDVDLAD